MAELAGDVIRARPSMFPLVAFDRIDDADADAALVAWGHWLGACSRPFGRQSFGLHLHSQLVAVAVSASTVNARCGGYDRGEVVELARLVSRPDCAWATRVCLRLWRELAPAAWGKAYWPVRACVSYANAIRHTGDVYRFDGWRRVADVAGGNPGVDTAWKRPRKAAKEPKSVWAWDVAARAPAQAGGTTREQSSDTTKGGTP